MRAMKGCHKIARRRNAEFIGLSHIAHIQTALQANLGGWKSFFAKSSRCVWLPGLPTMCLDGQPPDLSFQPIAARCVKNPLRHRPAIFRVRKARQETPATVHWAFQAP